MPSQFPTARLLLTPRRLPLPHHLLPLAPLLTPSPRTLRLPLPPPPLLSRPARRVCRPVLLRGMASAAAAPGPHAAAEAPAASGASPRRLALEELPWDHSFVRELPGDPRSDTIPREVLHSCYSKVSPSAKVDNPKLVAWSDSVADLLDLDHKELERPDFPQFFSGATPLVGSSPYAQCYGGHQFGVWAGQLGDGRAITLGEVVNSRGERWELQLKGSGKTPYSRFADGLAVLRSSIREFLCSEAMNGLGVPTTRALCLVETGKSVVRDMFYENLPATCVLSLRRVSNIWHQELVPSWTCERWVMRRSLPMTRSSPRTPQAAASSSRVIREVDGGSRYPALTKTNYSEWALPMKVKLRARALWHVIEHGDADDQEEMMVLDALCSAVPSEMVSSIADKQTAKEAWTSIEQMQVGNNRMKKSTTVTIPWKFDGVTFKDGESVEDFALRLQNMAAELATLGAAIEEAKVV